MIPRISLLVTLALLSSCQSKSQSTNQKTVKNITNSVNWEQSIDLALSKAANEKKILFVECYSPTCPVCQSIEPFFRNKEVAAEYNSNFICYKLDVGNASNVKWLNSRKIYLPSFPQFLFFDQDGKTLLHQSEVLANSESILNAARTARDVNMRSYSYKKRFENGNRELDFLINAASFARISMDSSFNEKVSLELFEIFPKDQLGSIESWAITKKCVTTTENGFSRFWLNNVPLAAKYESSNGHEGNEKNILGGIIQYSLLSPQAKFYTLDQLNLFRQYMANTGAGQYSDTYLWELEVNAALKENKPKLAIEIGDKIANKFIRNGQSLVYIVKVFNDSFKDNSYINSAKFWLSKAKGNLNDNSHMAEYYFELSRINLRAGDKLSAKENIDNAINLGTKANVDINKFINHSKSIK